MTLEYKTTDELGKLNGARLADERGRLYRWSRRCPLQQWIIKPVTGPHGYGEGYWRTASRKAQAAADKLLVDLGLLEGKVQRHARIARESLGF